MPVPEALGVMVAVTIVDWFAAMMEERVPLSEERTALMEAEADGAREDVEGAAVVLGAAVDPPVRGNSPE